MKLSDIVDEAAVADLIARGYIRERFHPNGGGLRILNYSEKAQYERVWTPETQACRGLILRGDEVIARPWPKFFNYGEHPEGSLDLTAPVEVTDKMDGSLGILYEGPDGWAISTRGSFTSDQAIHATDILADLYVPNNDWYPRRGWTYLFEIIFPENRIVIDYGDRDDIVLLGAVRISDGQAAGPDELTEWPGERTETFLSTTLADALDMPTCRNVEGVVVRFFETGLMVKIKQPDYIRLHRLITGLSERSIWEHLAAHEGDYTELIASIPDEFHGWVHHRAEEILTARTALLSAVAQAYNSAITDLPLCFGRKDFAARVATEPHRALLFLMFDDRDIAPDVWKMLKPAGSTPMKLISEDAS